MGRILAVESNPSLCVAATKNMAANGVNNVEILNCKSEYITKRLLGVSDFTSKTTDICYNFRAVLVDPPRCGLDPITTKCLATYSYIVYISCNPETLANNLRQISQTHDIQSVAVFDQFPWTDHLESGVLLQRKV